MIALSYDPSARYTELLGYADTVTAAFKSTFPAAETGSSRQAHALLATALSSQLRGALYRAGYAMNYASGAERRSVGDIVGLVAGRDVGTLATNAGVDPQTAANFANDFVTLAFPAIERLYNDLVQVAGSQLCVSFVEPYSLMAGLQTQTMISDHQQLVATAQAMIDAEAAVLNSAGSRNLAFLALVDVSSTILGIVGDALEYLTLPEASWNETSSRVNLISEVAGSDFAMFVGMFGVSHTAALEFASGYSAMALRAVGDLLAQLEGYRGEFAEEVAAGNAAAESAAAQAAAAAEAAAEQLAAAQAAAARDAEKQKLANQIGEIFGAKIHFQPPGRPTENFQRFLVDFDTTTNHFVVRVQVPTHEWPNVNQNPPATTIIGGETWKQFSARIPRMADDGTPVDVVVQVVSC